MFQESLQRLEGSALALGAHQLAKAFSSGMDRLGQLANLAREQWDSFTDKMRGAFGSRQAAFDPGADSTYQHQSARSDLLLSHYGLDAYSVSRLLSTMQDLSKDPGYEPLIVRDADGRFSDVRVDFGHMGREMQGELAQLYLGVAKSLKLLASSSPAAVKGEALSALFDAYGHLAGKDVRHATPHFVAELSRMSSNEALVLASVVGRRIIELGDARARLFQEFLADNGTGVSGVQRYAAMYQGAQTKRAAEAFFGSETATPHLYRYARDFEARFEKAHGADPGIAELWAFVRRETRSVLGAAA